MAYVLVVRVPPFDGIDGAEVLVSRVLIGCYGIARTWPCADDDGIFVGLDVPLLPSAVFYRVEVCVNRQQAVVAFERCEDFLQLVEELEVGTSDAEVVDFRFLQHLIECLFVAFNVFVHGVLDALRIRNLLEGLLNSHFLTDVFFLRFET